MRIGLAAVECRDFDLEFNLRQIERYARQERERKLDLLCFGESFLQGFQGLTWEYDQDIRRALRLDDAAVLRLRELACHTGVALSVGTIENQESLLYSSNLVIDADGAIADVFRRVSKGWKEPIATAEYCEGIGFHSFSLGGKRLTTAICGDLLNDDFLREMERQQADAVLWPVYLDFGVEEWNAQYLAEYAERVSGIACPVLMTNSFVADPQRANGGCYVFAKGIVLQALPPGECGVLEVEL